MLKLFMFFFLGAGFFIKNINAAENSTGLSVGVIGGWVYDNASLSMESASISTDSKSVFGGGITAEMKISPMLGIEADLLYIKHKFSRNTADFFGVDVSSTASSGLIQIPVLLRIHAIPFLNPGLGFYYGRVVTSWKVTANSFESKDIDYGKDDYGFVIALGSEIPLTGNINAVADLRYTQSLNDSGGGTDSKLDFSQVQLLLGIRLDL